MSVFEQGGSAVRDQGVGLTVVYVDGTAEGRVRFSAFLPGSYRVVAFDSFAAALDELHGVSTFALVACVGDVDLVELLETMSSEYPHVRLQLVARPVDVDEVARALTSWSV